MLVELRADGCQTMVPPSIHPSGDALRWERDGEPAVVEEAELRAKVAQVAACALLAVHWPQRGQRDEAALALCGMLIAGGWTAAEADTFTTAVARVAQDEEWAKRAKGEATARKLAAGAAVMGRKALAERLNYDGPRVVRRVAQWLGLAAPNGEAFAHGGPSHRGEAREEREGAGAGKTTRIIHLDEVPEEELTWLWEGRLPLGKTVVLDGDPGLGKSLLSLDLVARVVRGLPMPDGSPGRQGGAVILTTEDGLADTVRPRLRGAGVTRASDLHRVTTLDAIIQVDPTTGTPYERALSLTQDLKWIAEAAREVDARLIVIDPLIGFLPATVNTWRDQDVRAALAPLGKLAGDLGAAVLVLRHLNKSSGGNPLYRGGGSIGIGGAARAVWLVGPDPDDPDRGRVLAMNKNNLGPSDAPSLRFRVDVDEDRLPHVTWLGESPYNAKQVLAAAAAAAPAGPHAPRHRPAGRLGEAVAWLAAALAGGPRLRAELVAEAAQAGFPERMVELARQHVPATWRREGFGATSRTVWELEETAAPADSAES
ncbi:MAG TPA: AAA family ATPase [Ktedonobacterales bacterium]|nr:AAA family ATPase [Ktedonobacterales bacterium]